MFNLKLISCLETSSEQSLGRQRGLLKRVRCRWLPRAGLLRTLRRSTAPLLRDARSPPASLPGQEDGGGSRGGYNPGEIEQDSFMKMAELIKSIVLST